MAGPAWWYPGGGWLDPSAWVRHALATPGVKLTCGVAVQGLRRDGAEWQALGDAYRVSVRIVTMSQDGAVLVPVSAVFPLSADAAVDVADRSAGAVAAPRHAVFVVDAGHARQVPVQLAARNGSMAWLRSGVAPGQQVIVYPPAAVRDGVRVSARKV